MWAVQLLTQPWNSRVKLYPSVCRRSWPHRLLLEYADDELHETVEVL